ncbi:PLD nuclease N-terminal domain-containing protein [Actinomyces bowdenii]|uniref:PLDc_N domain-containing protein n=1 Tax=Actinomyces bowdenii TaxID=131109 RepID=A0A3P1V786_9ACTO|nr:PLD nuclease N-terminal domain-containing protein [Actinomyces bowdenii]RRD29527.1 PLDc_N domain-containing protein [Actinomyces bowdenii]
MRIVLIVLAFALVLYSLLDCARTPEENMPARMPKFLWIALIILFPTVGAIAWIIVSRVKAAEERGGYVEPTVWSSKEGTAFRRPDRPRPVAPDDDPEFLRGLEQGIRRRRHHPEQGDQAPGGAQPGQAGKAPGTGGTRSQGTPAAGSEGPGGPANGAGPTGEEPEDPAAPPAP